MMTRGRHLPWGSVLAQCSARTLVLYPPARKAFLSFAELDVGNGDLDNPEALCQAPFCLLPAWTRFVSLGSDFTVGCWDAVNLCQLLQTGNVDIDGKR